MKGSLVALWCLVAASGGSAFAPTAAAEEPEPFVETFLRGDANSDGRHSVSDVMTIVRYLYNFKNVPRCSDAADFDDSGFIDITDLVALANFVFVLQVESERRLPAEPFPLPGVDPTPDDIGCTSGVDAPGGGAADVNDPACTPATYLADTGVVGLIDVSPRHGQLVDFVLFARACIQAHPGQQLHIPLGIANSEPLDGFSVSVRGDAPLSLDEFRFRDTELWNYSPDRTLSFTGWNEATMDRFLQKPSSYLAAAVMMDFEEPFSGKVLPQNVRAIHVATLVVTVAADVTPGETLKIQLSNTPGVDVYHPSINNEFSRAGKAITPRFAERGVTIQIVGRQDLHVRGDADGDFSVTIGDAVSALRFLFQRQDVRCPVAIDTDGDGVLALADPVRVLRYRFLGGGPPALPFPHPGTLPEENCHSFSR